MFNRKPQADFEIFTIYDSKTESYDLPSFAINKNDLQRQILNMFKDAQQRNNKYLVNAEDFSVFKIGSFDKKTGKIEAHNLEHVCNMHDLRAMASPDLGIVPT